MLDGCDAVIRDAGFANRDARCFSEHHKAHKDSTKGTKEMLDAID